MTTTLEIVGVRAPWWAEQTGSERESVIIDAGRLAGQVHEDVYDLARFLSVSHNDDGCVDFWPETGGGVMVRNTVTGDIIARYVNGKPATEEWPPFAAPPPARGPQHQKRAKRARTVTAPGADGRRERLTVPDEIVLTYPKVRVLLDALAAKLRAMPENAAARPEVAKMHDDLLAMMLQRGKDGGWTFVIRPGDDAAYEAQRAVEQADA